MGRLDTQYLRNEKSEGARTQLTLATRWVPRRKAQVVAAVTSGALSLGEACHRYALTIEEFRSWERALEKDGLAGLRATHALDYRAGDRSAERHLHRGHGVERGGVEHRHA
jgi:transposase-like protein